MDLEHLKPWNWFKHEQGEGKSTIPVKHGERSSELIPSRGMSRHPLLQLQRELDRMFEDSFRNFEFPSFSNLFNREESWVNASVFTPDLNISSDQESYQIELEVPGMKESDISIEVKGGTLLIQGEKSEDKRTKERHFYRMERSYGRFQRTLALPDDADADNIQANLADGVLSLAIPRSEVTNEDVKKISINN
ncbi:MAG TPA: heat-shock protein [Gammaproteobacteria bacterium]|nr:heat-shock protein [Gammaproteobacteria bacterium]